MGVRHVGCSRCGRTLHRISNAMMIGCSHRTLRIFNVSFIAVNVMLLYFLLHGLFILPTPESYFYSPITSDQRNRMLTILRDFHSLMKRDNISYLMGAGTLLGSYRHHGPIPWDDDVDVFAFVEDKERIRSALTKNLPSNMSTYKFFEGDLGAPAWKFYDSTSPDWFFQHTFRWPYVDIFFLSRNSTHVWNEEFSPHPRRNDQIFPLTLRPFADMWLPSPCNPVYALNFLKIEECQNRAFSHLVGFSMPLWRQYRLRCTRLSNRFPFVSRRTTEMRDGRTVLYENLTIGHTVLYSLRLSLPKCGYNPASPILKHYIK